MANTLTIAYRDASDSVSLATKAIVEHAFTAIDERIVLTWMEMPLARSENALAKGIIDADFGRTRLVYQDIPEALYPEEPLMSINYYLFGHTHVLKPEDYQYVVGVIGDQVNVEIAKRYQWQLIRARTERDALNMVNSQRVQAMIGYGGIRSIIEKEQFTDVRIGEKPVETFEVFLVLHQRHQRLITPLNTVLRDMRDNGTTAAILAKHGL
ncbi:MULTISPECIES: substrate-binding periplasmic protein [unclassified Salinivibrio]|uniref:substrate-binding periplasmic protein n=1 Tax=unclassified Salinivibrio TaxID=2636825 RepID=UPI000985F972|nr:MULTISPECIES: transporter substrate-binding domain-containing protein [unclassified Salinivibrio]OOF10708.1 hypothetical protein BZG83_13515 [Salinivibrio sp. PR919]OOF14886.1 hypothetical protein BZG84_13375 [Salinivibrio sp. PR932]